MTVVDMARASGPEHASAVRRLATARDEERRLTVLSGPLAQERLSAAHASVAAREQWLHWIDEGESLAPWADGVWAPRDESGPHSCGGDLQGIKDRIARGEAALIQAVSGVRQHADHDTLGIAN